MRLPVAPQAQDVDSPARSRAEPCSLGNCRASATPRGHGANDHAVARRGGAARLRTRPLCFGVASAFGSPSASEGGRREQDSNLQALAGATLAPWWLTFSLSLLAEARGLAPPRRVIGASLPTRGASCCPTPPRNVGTPYGSRTRLSSVRTKCPEPLDERGVNSDGRDGIRTRNLPLHLPDATSDQARRLCHSALSYAPLNDLVPSLGLAPRSPG